MNIDEVLAQIPYARRMGITADLEDGAVITRMRFRLGLIGNHRIAAIHGGMVGAFLEMAAIAELIDRMGGDGIPKGALSARTNQSHAR